MSSQEFRNNQKTIQNQYETLVLDRLRTEVDELRMKIFAQFNPNAYELKAYEYSNQFGNFKAKLREIEGEISIPIEVRQLGNFSVRKYDYEQRKRILQEILQEGNIKEKIEEVDKDTAFDGYCNKYNCTILDEGVYQKFEASLASGEETIEGLIEFEETYYCL